MTDTHTNTDGGWALFGDTQPAPAPTTPDTGIPADAPTVSRRADPDHSATRQPLIALTGGPNNGHWYWLDQIGTAARFYQPTGRHIDNPNPTHGTGEVWTYQPPTATTEHAAGSGPRVDAMVGGSGGLTCPRCGQPAPRLIIWRQANSDRPRVECPRCAYPTTRYLGELQDTMPDEDKDWYDGTPAQPAVTVTTTPDRPTSAQPARVLFTGSRTLTDPRLIRPPLTTVRHRFPTATLVHGAAEGADRIAARIWTAWGLPTEAHPADWTGPCTPDCPTGHRRQRRNGTGYCPQAGLRRNRAMVTTGAHACLALIQHHSRGATHCATLAEQAGIPTWRPPIDGATTHRCARHQPGEEAA